MNSLKLAKSPDKLKKSRIADQILSDLKRQIVTGVLPKGAKLPPERELAEHYQVSGPTVREAIRVLSAYGLVDVRHGSGAYVTTCTESMLAATLGTIIQLEGLGAQDVLSVFGVLYVKAIELACTAANEDDHAAMLASLDSLDDATSSAEYAAAIRGFHHALATAAHNPLLTALCRFLAYVQTELGVELSGDSPEVWKSVLLKLRKPRRQLVEAIIARDEVAAVEYGKTFSAKVFKLITSLPKAKEVHLSDPGFCDLMQLMMYRLIESPSKSDYKGGHP